MKISEMAQQLGWETLIMPDPDVEVTGGYAGDLLSWVMGRAQAGNVWMTIMTNRNIMAVATLAGVSAVVVTEHAEIDGEIVKLAEEQDINLLRSAQPTFETAYAVGKLLEK
ncbi:MAG: hypothetical protein IJW99_08850 [Clostridia bacterium]|nr:hypothetical protein [Clostridia bacterium]